MANAGTGPFPPLPSKIRIPTFKVTSTPAGEIEIPSALPFYYAGIQSIWLYWQVDLPLLEAYLDPLGMSPANFGGAGAVGVNFFNAVALYGQGQPGNPGAAGFNETELNIMAYPTAVAASVPTDLSFEDFVAGGDQTKRIGAFRVWVACDDAVAVAAGRQLFFENKFLTSYTYDVPAPNNPGQSTWSWTCHDPADTTLDIYTAAVNLAGLSPTPGNMSEWIDLSYVESARRVAASRRNYLGMYDTYLLPGSGASAVSITLGQSTHPMRHDMQNLIGTRPAAAVQVFRSPTSIAEARVYWADL